MSFQYQQPYQQTQHQQIQHQQIQYHAGPQAVFNDGGYNADYFQPEFSTAIEGKKKKNKGKKKKNKAVELSKEEQFRVNLSVRDRRVLSNYGGHFLGLLQMEIDEAIRDALWKTRYWPLARCIEQGLVMLRAEGSLVKLGQQHKKNALKKLAMHPGLALGNTGFLGALFGPPQPTTNESATEQSVEVLVRFCTDHAAFQCPHSFMPGDLCWLRPFSAVQEPLQAPMAFEVGVDENGKPLPPTDQKLEQSDWHIDFEGVVDNCGRDFLVASFTFPPELEAQKTQQLLSGVWRIDKGPSIVSYKRMVDAVKTITSHQFEGPTALRHIVCRLHHHARYPPQDPWDTSIPPPLDPRYQWQNFAWNAQDPELTNRDLAIDPRVNHAALPQNVLTFARHILEQQPLNQSQKNSIAQVLTNTLSLIQGPPGTGKTTTSVILLKLWVSDLGMKPALASAFSNVAVDQMLAGLIKWGINAVRIGDPERVNSDLIRHTMKYREENHPLAPELFQLRENLKVIRSRVGDTPQNMRDLSMTYKKAKKLQKQIEDDILSSCDVILATCVGAGATVLNDRTFSLILVDECTQATEPSCLIPLVKSRPDTHVVLIGDQCQLPPTMSCDKLKYTGLKVSLFERMLQIPVHENLVTENAREQDTVGMTSFCSTTVPFMGILPVRLLTQYRMHPLISSWPNEAFYDGHLKNGVKETDRVPPAGFPWPAAGPACFVPMEYHEDSVQGKSKRNSHEAAAVVRIVDMLLLGGEVEPGDIGVVTPYVGQVRKLRQLFGDTRRRKRPGELENEELGVVVEEGRYANLEIMSVDGYQGREKEVIVFSCVRSNSSGNVGFLADQRRLNVAITRARRGLIVVGNPATLESHPVWKLWLGAMQERNLVVQYSQLKPLTGSPSSVPSESLSPIEQKHDIPM